jgi:hypothetical protein
MKTLLEKLSIILLRYEKLSDNDKFNIFQILRQSHDEVNLHSRFIYELLNPQGTHGLGNRLAELFIENLEVENFDLKKYEVYREYKHIDIFIKNSETKQAIIIENKIYANDQDKQLEGYYRTIEGEGYEKIYVFYLTLDGREPKENNKFNEKMTLISYKNEIDRWLDRCVEVASRHPTLRETLIQYQKLIRNLTGQNKNQMQKDEIIKLLSENKDNILSAKMIVQNWGEIQKHIEIKFWECLESKLNNNNFNVLKGEEFPPKYTNYNYNYITSVYNKSRGKNPYYGIAAKLYEKDNYLICIYFERGFGDIYYGLTLVKDNNRGESFKEEFRQISPKNEKFINEAQKIIQHNPENRFWFGFKNTETKINFENSNDETLKLIDENHRKKVVNQIVIEVETYLLEVHKIHEEIYS